MFKFFDKKYLLILVIFIFSACSTKSYHKEMVQDMKKSFDKKDYRNIKDTYASSLIEEKLKTKEYINVLEDKTLGDILREMELIDGNYYFLKSSDVLVPKSRVKIYDINSLNKYLKAVLDKELFIKKSDDLYLVKLLNSSETKKRSIKDIAFRLNGQISVEELIKLIISQSGYEVAIGNYIENRDSFQNSIISVNSKNILEALNSLAQAKGVYVDMDYEKETIYITRYKDTVIELNIPLLNLETSSKSSTSEVSGQSRIENKSQIALYEELNNMLKNIISSDKVSTYHIDKASGLIFLKSTKSVEKAVRTVVKAYEQSFSREATIEFERIEIVLNKNREYGIGSISEDKRVNKDSNLGVFKGIASGGILNFSSNNISRLLKITAKADNGIGKILNYSKNLMVLKNNIPSVQAISQNTDYIERIETTVNDNVTSSQATVNTIKDGTSITAMAKISRDKIFLNLTPNIKKLIKISEATVGTSTIQLPQYNDQSYNISREIKLGETSIVGSVVVHDDSKTYKGILPLEYFAVGGTDSKSYVRREIIYVVTLKSIKGF